jgi:hypothetical protein
MRLEVESDVLEFMGTQIILTFSAPHIYAVTADRVVVQRVTLPCEISHKMRVFSASQLC